MGWQGDMCAPPTNEYMFKSLFVCYVYTEYVCGIVCMGGGQRPFLHYYYQYWRYDLSLNPELPHWLTNKLQWSYISMPSYASHLLALGLQMCVIFPSWLAFLLNLWVRDLNSGQRTILGIIFRNIIHFLWIRVCYRPEAHQLGQKGSPRSPRGLFSHFHILNTKITSMCL